MEFKIGDAGHLGVTLALVSALVGGIAYFMAAQTEGNQHKSWVQYGRMAFGVHALSVFTVVISLFVIIHSHDYRYHYAWSHSSNDLPVHYMISCFWEGQEGSFLLWIFWHVVLSFFIVVKKGKWEGPVMTVILGVQLLLCFMIIGTASGDVKLGSSPFTLLSEVFQDAPIFATNPEYMPADGNGLNPLLQNYWMVIHPPTLFLGFALTLIPFAYLIAGLWKKDFYGWVKPALSWSLVCGAILGTGIVMGGFWAYETLNFGGYWNWDPVENAVYVPWITLVVAIHALLIYKRKGGALGYSMVMVAVTYFLILYSTFLTRSGVLGDSSVHSFTDLGLFNQLLVFMLAPLALFLVMYFMRSSKMPKVETKTTVYSKDFWVLIGTVVVLLGAFHVIITTSIPFFNKIFHTHNAPPADAPSFYSRIQIWFAMLMVLFAGIGQYVWWNKSDASVFKQLRKRFFVLLGAMLLFSGSFILIKEYTLQDAEDSLLGGLLAGDGSISVGKAVIYLVSYVLLLGTSLFSILTSATVIQKLWKAKRLHGGAIAHIGFAVMLIGILFSAGYSRVVSLNKSGLVYSREMPEDMNTENVLLWSNSPLNMEEYALTFRGKRIELKGYPEYVDVRQVLPGMEEGVLISRDTLKAEGKVYFVPGDTVEAYEENMFYEVAYAKEGEHQFSLFPRAQDNPKMGFLASPDIERTLFRDLYTHVSSVPDPEQIEWTKPKTHVIKRDGDLIINDFIGRLDTITVDKEVTGVTMPQGALAFTAHLDFVLENNQIVTLKPAFVMAPNSDRVGYIDDVSADLGIQIQFLNINPETGEFAFLARTTQKDYIIMKVVEKPLINLLWLGTIVCMGGFAVSAVRRIREKDQSKEMKKNHVREEHLEQV